ncbi:flavodoxin family protein [Acetobacterium paludosum]|uniref:flavodoxin family protein n=1 Tax=Acetobacterium paludosum TaxID=52693 RepID=UPI0014785C50|nr:flavodoxin family protein [Acetobacterium paludosum]
MRIISLVSSYRTNGNTNKTVSLIEQQLLSIANKEKITLEIEKILLSHFDIKTCCGCRACFDKGEEKCPLKDELLFIWEKIYQADGILAASPVYVEDVNGIMKNWIDRMAFNCHRPAFAGKNVFIVTTSGGGSSNHTINTMKNAFTTWGMNLAGSSKFRTGKQMDSVEIESRYSKEIKKVAEALFKAVKNKSNQRPSFYSLITFRVQQKCWQKSTQCQDTVDYKYWQRNEWLQRDCNYYIPNKASFLKIKFAQLIGSIVAIFYM